MKNKLGKSNICRCSSLTDSVFRFQHHRALFSRSIP